MIDTKIAIIGAGNVGCSSAFALLLQGLASEIILIDSNQEKAFGESKDLGDVLAFSHTKTIRVGSYNDACKSDIVIISAGCAQKPGESRRDLFSTNTQVIQSICKNLSAIQPNAIVIIVTNPLDALTYVVQNNLPLSKNQIFGTGTWLDSQRLRRFIAQELDVTPHDVEAYMLGEHGDSQFAVYSLCRVLNKNLSDYSLSQETLDTIETNVKNEVYSIIQAKCATYYGIAACVTDICKAIINDEKKLIPLSVYDEKYNVCISKFVQLGRNGIDPNVQVSLSEKEIDLYERSALFIKEIYQ